MEPMKSKSRNELKDWVADAHSKMVEAAVEADDEVMEKYLEGEEIPDNVIMNCLVKGIRQGIHLPCALRQCV